MWSPTHVRVTVQKARNLQSKGRKGTNDAFVLIQMGKEKYQTTVKEKSISPEWYEECDLSLLGRDSDVMLTAYHRNALGLDEFLGQTVVSLRGIESFDRPFTKWYPLKGKSEKSEDKIRGELEVKIAFVVHRCSDTQSLNDLSFKKRRNSIKNLAVSVGHKIQKFPSRSMSLKNFDPRKHLERLKEKRHSISSDSDLSQDYSGTELPEEYYGSMKRHGSLYSSTLSLPQSGVITSSIKEAESLEELPQSDTPEETVNKINNTDSPKETTPKPLPRRNSAFSLTETKLTNGEWTNRILNHAKESPMARSETNLIEALKAERSEVPTVPMRKTKLEALRHNLRRHTLQFSEAPILSNISYNNQKKSQSDIFKLESLRTNNVSIPEGIPQEVVQQFEKMNHKDLVLLAIKQQADLERQRDRILDLENYLDNLLVRVMETTPRILQKPYVSPACHR